MALFKVCDHVISIDVTGSDNFRGFLLQADSNPSRKTDLSFARTREMFSYRSKRLACNLNGMTIWSVISKDSETYWQFESDDGLCAIAVDENYTHAQYQYEDTLSFFGDRLIGNVLAAYFQIVISCKLLQSGFTVLHAACVEEEGQALAFTGPSGVGKSARGRKWVELFGSQWISGDRPAVNGSSGIAYGVPWDGKEKIYRNVQRPLAAIISVSRSETPYIRTLGVNEGLHLLCEQTFLPLWDVKLAAVAMHTIRQLCSNVHILELGCDITDESIYEAHRLLHCSLGS